MGVESSGGRGLNGSYSNPDELFDVSRLWTLSRGHIVALVMTLYALLTQAGGTVRPENLALVDRVGNTLRDLPNNEATLRNYGSTIDWGGVLPDLRPRSTLQTQSPARGPGPAPVTGEAPVTPVVFDE